MSSFSVFMKKTIRLVWVFATGVSSWHSLDGSLERFPTAFNHGLFRTDQEDSNQGFNRSDNAKPVIMLEEWKVRPGCWVAHGEGRLISPIRNHAGSASQRTCTIRFVDDNNEFTEHIPSIQMALLWDNSTLLA